MNRRSGQKTLLFSALLSALALGGCGSSSSTSSTSRSSSATQANASHSTPTAATTASQSTSTTSKPTREKLPTISLPLKIPIKGERLPARYTCDGANISLPVSWSEIPANTTEIDLFIFNSAMVNGKLTAAWAVAGLKPTLRGLSAGRVPRGAIIGRNGFGQTRYSVCPPRGSTGNYIALLAALPRRISVMPGFDPNTLINKAVTIAEFEGRLGFSYKRG